MIASSRSTASSVRSLLRSASSQQVPVAPSRLNQNRPSSSLSSSSSPASSSAASSSRLTLPSSSRAFNTSGVQSTVQGSKSPSPSTPSKNAQLTPRAAQDVSSVQKWLRNAFPALPFPDNLALQMITHESWDHGVSAGHTRRLSFIGRRAMKFYLTLFLMRHSADSKMFQTDRLTDILNTQRVGDSVGRSLKLEEVMRWTPAVDQGQKGPKETGLYKIRGGTVEALLGAIYHQHGALAAKAFFSARILPTLNTFLEEEVEALRSSIESEAELGKVMLNSLETTEGHAINPTRAVRDEKLVQEVVHRTSEAVAANESRAEGVNETRPTSTTSSSSSASPNIRKRTATSASNSIPLEDQRSSEQHLEGRSNA